MSKRRERQLEYSRLQPLMLNEASRRAKASKIGAVLKHFLGKVTLEDLRLLDIGCSGGIVTAEFARMGAKVIGADIDEPGVRRAAERFGRDLDFILSDAEHLPIRTGSVDIVVLNHIYEHVLDPPAVVREIRRVLTSNGVVYLGLGNRLGIIEPHYRLPFLSWLPRPLANAYVRASKRADVYHEKFLTRPSLKRLFGAFRIWDYTFTVIADAERFEASDVVPPKASSYVARLPSFVRDALLAIVPTYIWVGSVDARGPSGGTMNIPPRLIKPTSNR